MTNQKRTENPFATMSELELRAAAAESVRKIAGVFASKMSPDDSWRLLLSGAASQHRSEFIRIALWHWLSILASRSTVAINDHRLTAIGSMISPRSHAQLVLGLDPIDVNASAVR